MKDNTLHRVVSTCVDTNVKTKLMSGGATPNNCKSFSTTADEIRAADLIYCQPVDI